MSFYTYDQNNSGGAFDFDADAGIAHYVIVEAASSDDADERAERIGIYFDGCDDGRDCDCCGDRWYRAWSDGDDAPLVYGHDVYSYKNLDWSAWRRHYPDVPEAFVHYVDGTVKPAMVPS